MSASTRATAAWVELWVQPAKTGDAAGGGGAGDLNDAEPLGFGEGGGLAGGAAGDEELDAGFDLGLTWA